MRLTELVKDPFSDFGEEDEPTPAEAEGREAMKKILDEARNDPTLPESVRAVLQPHQDEAV
jgi:hypothetical protein